MHTQRVKQKLMTFLARYQIPDYNFWKIFELKSPRNKVYLTFPTFLVRHRAWLAHCLVRSHNPQKSEHRHDHASS